MALSKWSEPLICAARAVENTIAIVTQIGSGMRGPRTPLQLTPDLAAVTPIAALALALSPCSRCPAAGSWWPGPGAGGAATADRNGVLYDADGQVVCESVLGDGIGHVLATSDGQVWTGYFDGGIYGNYGWGQDGTEEPVGAYGIVRFSPDWRPSGATPRYTEVGPWDAVSDCYALNVDDVCAWACYYSDFPVVCIRDGAVTGWHNDIKGASALAVAGSRVALFGGYGPDHDRLALTELGADHARPAGQYRVVLPGGEHHPPAPRSPAAEAACISSPEPAGTSSTWTISRHDRAEAKRRISLMHIRLGRRDALTGAAVHDGPGC